MSTVTLSFTDPTTRTDGSALNPGDIANINIFDDASVTWTSYVADDKIVGWKPVEE